MTQSNRTRSPNAWVTGKRTATPRLFGVAVGAMATLTLSAAAKAESVADFYKDKTITLINGFPTGGPAQASVDVFIKYFTKHIPGNPTIVSKNMPGAGTLRAANFVLNAADKDGTVIGLFSANALLSPLWKKKGAEYDPRTSGWLGSPNRRPTGIAVFRTDAPAKTFEEARKVEMTVGSTGAGASSSVYARLLNATTGTKFKLILGYKGGPRVMLAMEQGEVHGRVGYSWGALKRRQKNLLDANIIHVIAQLSTKPDPELTAMGVPVALDYVKDPQDKKIMSFIFGVEEMSRPYAVPPGVPADRLAALRKALAETAKDPEYVTEVAAKNTDPVNLTTGEEMVAFIKDAYNLPQPLVDRTIAIMNGK